MKKNDRLLWTNCPDINALCRKYEKELVGLSDSEKRHIVLEMNADALTDIRKALDIWLDRPILLIAKYELWDGTRSSISEIGSNNIKDCLYSNCDVITWFLDSQGDLRADGKHEMGINHYLYRTWKDDVTPRQKQMMWQRVSDGLPVERDIASLTRPLGKEISRVYGWKLPTKPSHNKRRMK